MASDILDRVAMVITDTGTGDVTASVLISNRFNTPAEAGAVNARSYWWMLEEGTDYEIFEGVWTLSGTKVSRVTVWQSKIAGVHGTTKMTLAGNATLRSITPAEALDAMLRVDKDQSALFSATQKAQGRANLGVFGRNRIINGQFAINQRGVGGVDNTYASDRWRSLLEGSGVNLFPDNYNAAGGNVPGLALQFTGTTDKGGQFQIIEGRNCKDLRGKTVTLSLLMLVSNARLGNMKIGILEWTGAEDATSGDPIASWGADGVTPTLATNWAFKNTPTNLNVTTASALYSTTVTLGTTFNNLGVMIWNDDKVYSANDNFSFTNAQLEEGGVATPFDQRGFGEELRRCMRYCLALGSSGSVAYELFASGNVSSSTNFYASVPFPEKMRVAPALIASAANSFICASGGGVAVGSAISLSVSSPSAAQLALTTSGLTSGQAGSLQANNTEAAKLVFDAEL